MSDIPLYHFPVRFMGGKGGLSAFLRTILPLSTGKMTDFLGGLTFIWTFIFGCIWVKKMAIFDQGSLFSVTNRSFCRAVSGILAILDPPKNLAFYATVACGFAKNMWVKKLAIFEKGSLFFGNQLILLPGSIWPFGPFRPAKKPCVLGHPSMRVCLKSQKLGLYTFFLNIDAGWPKK